MERLRDKVALITGAARGMGAAHARLFAEEGATVVVADVRDDEGRRLAEELIADGSQAMFVHLDVTNAAQWAEVVEHTITQFAALDVLVNNAGVAGQPGGLDGAGDWDATVAVNQTGTFLGMRTAARVMRSAGCGSIVNVSSILGVAGDGDFFAYGATKGAVRMMTRNAAIELAPHGVRVNCVCPGMVETTMNSDPEDAAPYIAATPMRRMADPRELSYGVLYLASDEASFVTGADLVVDGGYLAR